MNQRPRSRFSVFAVLLFVLAGGEEHYRSPGAGNGRGRKRSPAAFARKRLFHTVARIWKNRRDLGDTGKYVRRLRKDTRRQRLRIGQGPS